MVDGGVIEPLGILFAYETGCNLMRIYCYFYYCVFYLVREMGHLNSLSFAHCKYTCTMSQQELHFRTESQDKVAILMSWCAANEVIIHPDLEIVSNQPPTA
jgi:hypothetical protein